MLAGRIFTGNPVVVLPGPGWFESAGHWQVRGEASLVCVVEHTPATPLVVTISIAEPRIPFTILWDDEVVTSRMKSVADGSFEVAIDPKRLTPGPHELTFLTHHVEDRPAFSDLGYRIGEARRSFLVRDRLRYFYASSLLSRGVTSIDKLDTLGGFLFEGPQTQTLVAENRGRRFSTTIENGSFDDAEFVITAGAAAQSVRLRPFERRSVAFALPTGANTLGLTVRGHGDGMFLWGAPLVEPDARDERPPIVLITLDTVRKDALGPYGGDRAKTPALTAFAEQASVYDNAYSTSSWTLPAHASIFTGFYPSRHGAGVLLKHLGAEHRTLAEELRNGGYDTAGFAGGLLCRFPSGLAQGFLTYRDPEGFETADAALTENIVARLAASKNAPLFLFANYFGSHFPFEGVTPTKDGSLTPLFELAIAGDSNAWERIVRGEVAASADDLQALRAAYLANVSSTDAEMAKLFDALRRAGLYDDAMIVVVSDHGELLGERGFFMHGSRVDDELVAVPLMIKWPRQKRGTRERELVSIVDLFPTILRAAGLTAPPSDGIDLSRASASALSAREAIVIEEHERPFHPFYPNMKIDTDLFRLQTRERMMIVTNSAKICHLPGPAGWREVDCASPEAADMPSIPELVRDSFRATPRSHREMDDEQIQNLRSLGYLQ